MGAGIRKALIYQTANFGMVGATIAARARVVIKPTGVQGACEMLNAAEPMSGAGSFDWKSRNSEAARVAPPCPRVGVCLGVRLYRALCGDILCIWHLSHRLWIPDGCQAVALRRSGCGPDICADIGQYLAVCWHRCEP